MRFHTRPYVIGIVIGCAATVALVWPLRCSEAPQREPLEVVIGQTQDGGSMWVMLGTNPSLLYCDIARGTCTQLVRPFVITADWCRTFDTVIVGSEKARASNVVFRSPAPVVSSTRADLETRK